jgi:hypothetical protein
MSLELLKLLLSLLGQALQIWLDGSKKKQKALKSMQKARARLDELMTETSVKLACEVEGHKAAAFETSMEGKILMPKHTKTRVKHHVGSGLYCPKCTEMLKTASPAMRKIALHCFVHFGDKPKSGGGLHVSSVFRTQAEQDLAYKSGATPIKTGSKHQATDKGGKPAARAVDFFCLSADGREAVYDDSAVELMRKINVWANLHKVPLVWGGQFKNVKGDFCHFELSCVVDNIDYA